MNNVEFTVEAEHDLLSIDSYIAADDPAHSQWFVDELVARCHSLVNFPDRCQVAVRRGRRTIRKMPHGNYIIFYAVNAGTIEIIRILNAKQDWPAVLR